MTDNVTPATRLSAVTDGWGTVAPVLRFTSPESDSVQTTKVF